MTDLEADVTGGGVRIEWKIEADEKVRGFRLYREAEHGKTVTVIPNYGLLPPETRSFTDDGVRAGGKYTYTLAAVKSDGSEQLSQKISVETKAPLLALNQNYPNPFAFSTNITFTLNEKAHATLAVYDLQGRLIRKLVDGNLDRGFNEKFWDGRDSKGVPVGSGVYFYRLSAGEKTFTRKMVLMR